MADLDPIAGANGTYYAVYMWRARSTPPGYGNQDFNVGLAGSNNLTTWWCKNPSLVIGAGDATLRRVPGATGYILADEEYTANPIDTVVLRYYPNVEALAAGHYSSIEYLPRKFSTQDDGTPSIVSIRWRGSLSKSVIDLAFSYDKVGKNISREATGVLIGFRLWVARPATHTDAELTAAGFTGSHGQMRQFTYDGRPWRLYEAQRSCDAICAQNGDFSNWQLVLDDVSSGRMYPLTLEVDGQADAPSFGNPTASVLPAPDGRGKVLVVTTFVFYAGSSTGTQELLYYAPLTEGHREYPGVSARPR
jgi:hypothetical protein